MSLTLNDQFSDPALLRFDSIAQRKKMGCPDPMPTYLRGLVWRCYRHIFSSSWLTLRRCTNFCPRYDRRKYSHKPDMKGLLCRHYRNIYILTIFKQIPRWSITNIGCTYMIWTKGVKWTSCSRYFIDNYAVNLEYNRHLGTNRFFLCIRSTLYPKEYAWFSILGRRKVSFYIRGLL